jgi:hypothetical protein
MHWVKKLSLGVLLLAGVLLLLYAMDRRFDHGATVRTTYVSGEILSAVSGRHGKRYTVKLDDTSETIVISDSTLLVYSSGISIPLERREYADGAIDYRVAERE